LVIAVRTGPARSAERSATTRFAEAAAGHPGPRGAGLDRGLDGRVGLRPGNSGLVAE